MLPAPPVGLAVSAIIALGVIDRHRENFLVTEIGSRRTLSRLRGRGDQPKGWWGGEPQTPAPAQPAHDQCVGHPPPTTLSRGPPSPVNGRGSPDCTYTVFNQPPSTKYVEPVE
jgi:hypothetical protein